ncbi:MAG: phosphate ABC transporter permease family protein, partial [Sandaracinobacteroides sp.]
MSWTVAFLGVLLVAALGYWLGRQRALGFVAAEGTTVGAVHSRPQYHGAFVGILALLPALALLAVWALVGDGLVAREVLASVPAGGVADTDLDRSSFLSEVRGLVRGDYAAAFNPNAEAAALVWKASAARWGFVFGLGALALAAIGTLWGWSRLRPQFRARTQVESLTMILLVTASLMAILTTFGIVASLVFESFRFFQMVSPIEFLFGTSWSPQTAIR